MKRPSKVFFVFGNAHLIDYNGKATGDYSYLLERLDELDIKKIDYIPQVSAFWRNKIFKEFGGLNNKYKYVLDWDYWIRISEKYKLFYMDKIIGCNRIYSNTKTSTGGWERQKEILEVLLKYNGITKQGIKVLFAEEIIESSPTWRFGNILLSPIKYIVGFLGRFFKRSKNTFYQS